MGSTIVDSIHLCKYIKRGPLLGKLIGKRARRSADIDGCGFELFPQLFFTVIFEMTLKYFRILFSASEQEKLHNNEHVSGMRSFYPFLLNKYYL